MLLQRIRAGPADHEGYDKQDNDEHYVLFSRWRRPGVLSLVAQRALFKVTTTRPRTLSPRAERTHMCVKSYQQRAYQGVEAGPVLCSTRCFKRNSCSGAPEGWSTRSLPRNFVSIGPMQCV